MTEPTVEEVREALKRWSQWDDDDLSIGKDHPFWPLMAAARLWVDAAEPNMEAVKDLLEQDLEVQLDIDEVRDYVAAAFGDNTLIRRAK